VLKIPSEVPEVPNDEKVEVTIVIRQKQEGAVTWPELDAFTFNHQSENNEKQEPQ
jgi:hypothetical protein